MKKPLKRKGTKPGLGAPTERRLAVARAALFYERMWPRAWPLIGLVLAFLGLAWFDLFRGMPGYAHGLLLVVFIGLGGLAVWHLARGFHIPTRAEGLARVERDSGLAHRPLQTLSDSLALGRRDPASEALWRAHLKRAAQALQNLHVRPPRPDVPDADPYGLRVVVVAFALLGLFFAGPDWHDRLSYALAPHFGAKAASTVGVDAWITPPAYTRAAPIFLTRTEQKPAHEKFVVPQGSVMTVRVSGTSRAPHIRRHIKSASVPPGWRANLSMTADGSGAFKIDLPLGVDQAVDVMGGDERLGRWDVALTPDAPPAIAFKEAPSANAKDLLTIAYKAADDYGVASAAVRIQPLHPAEAASREERDLAIADPSVPLVLPISLAPGHPKSTEAKEVFDLTANPWAGLPVAITLAATDDAGHTSMSAPVTFTLPERKFHEPLAKAIIEQRRILAAAPQANHERVREALDALTLAPERFMPDTVVYLGLRSAYFRLDAPLTRESVKSVYDLFWNLALRIEDGDLTLAEQNLRDIQSKLMDALSNGASDDQIKDLMNDLKTALDRYMQALAQQAAKAMARGEVAPQMPGQNVVSSKDFQDLMRSIEDMARTGARGQARQMLSQLQDILNNLKVGGGGAGMTQSEQAMSNALKDLEGMLNNQKNMLDETYRKSGRGAAPRKDDRSMTALARDQAQLREQLEKLMGKLGGNMPQGNQSLQQAGQAMGDSQDKLGAGDPNGAINPQGHAIDDLQKGMQGLAQALAQSMSGRMGVASGQAGGRDPLGRRRGGMGALSDDNVEVPTEMQLQRARKILEEIERRASDPNRNRKELDYLDRLLKRFD